MQSLECVHARFLKTAMYITLACTWHALSAQYKSSRVRLASSLKPDLDIPNKYKSSVMTQKLVPAALVAGPIQYDDDMILMLPRIQRAWRNGVIL